MALGTLIGGGFFAGTALEHGRGLRLWCSHACSECVLYENYGIATRVRRFADRADRRVGLVMTGRDDATTLILIEAEDRNSEIAYTRPRPRAEAAALIAGQTWESTPDAPDLDVRIDERPRSISLAIGWLLAAFTLLIATNIATDTWLEIRASERRLVFMRRGLLTAYRWVVKGSIDFAEIADVSLGRTGRGFATEYTLLAHLRSGDQRLLCGFGARQIAEQHLAALASALKDAAAVA